MSKLELRMYGLVIYNASPIQQAIQYGHAVVEYGLKFFNDEDYQDWAKYCKTFIVLSGGFSNHTPSRYLQTKVDAGYDNVEHVGSMEKNLEELIKNDIKFATFFEEDLNDAMTAIVFLVDEKVFDRKKYPDFNLEGIYGSKIPDNIDHMDPVFPSRFGLLGSVVREKWEEWVESIGGRKNLFMREWLKNFKLA